MSIAAKLTRAWRAVLSVVDGSAAEPVDSPENGAALNGPAPRRSWTKWVARWLRRGVAAGIALWLTVVAVLAGYMVVDPWRSNLMLARAMGGTPLTHQWVDLDNVSKHVVHAVVPSEDARFCTHWGVDLGEIRDAIKRADERGPRGASTISMQTAKNMFLWSARSYVRKAIELPLAMTMDLVWSKRRMLEIYLNFAEWGPGVFGIEAASRHHFGTTAAKLTAQQAALLVAALPNPFKRRAGRAGPKTRAYARVVRKRMANGPRLTECIGLE